MLVRIFLPLFLFINIHSAFAVDDNDLINKTKLLLKKIETEHVSPRKLDAAFAKSVNVNLIEYLDPNFIMFTQEDELAFSEKETELLSDLKNGTLTYFTFVRNIFNTRLEAYSKRCTEIYGKTIALEYTGPKYQLGKVRPSLATQKEHWDQYILESFYDDMLDKLSSEERSFPKDSISVWSEKIRSSLNKRTPENIKALKDDERLGDLYLNAIAQSFDPHTNFFSKGSKNRFEEELNPEREIYGITIEMNMTSEVLITDIAPGSPAWLSNEVHEGNKVHSIKFKNDAEIIFDGSVEKYRLAIKTFDETDSKEIDILIEENDQTQRNVHLVKSRVYSDQDIIKNAVLDGEKKIGYIALPDFYVNWTDTSDLGCANDLAKCLIKLKKDSIQGLILDLRGNGGGSLREAVDIVGIFIDFGPVLAVKNQDKSIDILKDFNRGSIYNGPLMIMIDDESASASEIVAGSLQDYNRALIFGTPSFGKATSQIVMPLDPKIHALSEGLIDEDPNLGYANITVGQLYRINGGWNQIKGVQPDVLWTLDSDKDLFRESSYREVLVPDSLNKKINFTAHPKFKKESLIASSSQRMTTIPHFISYKKISNELNNQYDNEINSFKNSGLNNSLLQRNNWYEIFDKYDAFKEQLICNFTPKTNHFDRALIAADEILRMYNTQFLESLTKDVQLMEGVNIMTELINNR